MGVRVCSPNSDIPAFVAFSKGVQRAENQSTCQQLCWWFWPIPKAHSSSQPISPRLKKWPFIKIYHQNPYIYYHPDRYLTPPTKSESWKLQQLRNKKSVLEVPPHPRPHSTRIPSRRNEGQKRASGTARNGENALKPIHFTLKCIKPCGHLPSVCQLLVWFAGYNDITIYIVFILCIHGGYKARYITGGPQLVWFLEEVRPNMSEDSKELHT